MQKNSRRIFQKYLRDIALYGVEEIFEALQHLKNWKAHRQTDLGGDFNRDDFLEEMVDAYVAQLIFCEDWNGLQEVRIAGQSQWLASDH